MKAFPFLDDNNYEFMSKRRKISGFDKNMNFITINVPRNINKTVIY